MTKTKKLDVDLSSTEFDLLYLMIRAGGGAVALQWPQYMEAAAALTNKLLARSDNFIPVEVRDGMIQQIKTIH